MIHIKVSLDWEKFSNKPSYEKQYKEKTTRSGKEITEVMELGMRVGSNVERIELSQLASAISSEGRTFSPFVFNYQERREGDTRKPRRRRLAHLFESCECFCLDFDSGKPIEEILETAKEKGLTPNIVHESFSSSEELRKYRMLFVLDRQYTDGDEVRMMINTLLKWFPYADAQAKDLARIFFGSNKGLLEFNDKVRNTIPIDKEVRESYHSNLLKDVSERTDGDSGFIFGDIDIDTEVCLKVDPKQRKFLQATMRKAIQEILSVNSSSEKQRYNVVFGLAERLTGIEGLTGWRVYHVLTEAISRNPYFDNWHYDPEKVILDAIEWKSQQPNVRLGKLFHISQLEEKNKK